MHREELALSIFRDIIVKLVDGKRPLDLPDLACGALDAAEAFEAEELRRAKADQEAPPPSRNRVQLGEFLCKECACVWRRWADGTFTVKAEFLSSKCCAFLAATEPSMSPVPQNHAAEVNKDLPPAPPVAPPDAAVPARWVQIDADGDWHVLASPSASKAACGKKLPDMHTQRGHHGGDLAAMKDVCAACVAEDTDASKAYREDGWAPAKASTCENAQVPVPATTTTTATPARTPAIGAFWGVVSKEDRPLAEGPFHLWATKESGEAECEESDGSDDPLVQQHDPPKNISVICVDCLRMAVPAAERWRDQIEERGAKELKREELTKKVPCGAPYTDKFAHPPEKKTCASPGKPEHGGRCSKHKAKTSAAAEVSDAR